ncbi:MAG: type II toxin-antitoxin system VapC family toxin [Bacteroidetes bacterium]|nr:type II toxin-antitoxin system VapC family toxin [Bacteroidota bacterium]MBU1373565.1 type II toxin-antitoxin system VapC family toxin [Bacteroidota bacterium]MBU1484397.1 type II toxin-antitoxin system VapC family toxin [Bacteroidota bacterium]MBU1760577.1 type II toxin-antitoxin system VapC family toxin [Bacteroidota bacterium]MBU2046144.1 type II toxin-antitoxin system VapC family toxin [Bacteroidota bacterium]
MKYLIDTQILIWFQISPNKIKNEILDIIQDTSNQIFISDISLFEITIKQNIKKLPEFPVKLDDIIFNALKNDFSFIGLTHKLFSVYLELALHEYHKDPFDRMIISTALAEEITIISSDEKFLLYNHLVKIIKA